MSNNQLTQYHKIIGIVPITGKFIISHDISVRVINKFSSKYNLDIKGMHKITMQL
jgi:hypothetical protein